MYIFIDIVQSNLTRQRDGAVAMIIVSGCRRGAGRRGGERGVYRWPDRQ